MFIYSLDESWQLWFDKLPCNVIVTRSQISEEIETPLPGTSFNGTLEYCDIYETMGA